MVCKGKILIRFLGNCSSVKKTLSEMFFGSVYIAKSIKNQH